MEIDTGGAKKVFDIITLVFFCSDFKWSVGKKTKQNREFTLASHKGRRQSSEPIKTQSKYSTCHRRKARENVRLRVMTDFAFTCDWVKKWHEFFEPIAGRSVLKQNQRKRVLLLGCN